MPLLRAFTGNPGRQSVRFYKSVFWGTQAVTAKGLEWVEVAGQTCCFYTSTYFSQKLFCLIHLKHKQKLPKNKQLYQAVFFPAIIQRTSHQGKIVRYDPFPPRKTCRLHKGWISVWYYLYMTKWYFKVCRQGFSVNYYYKMQSNIWLLIITHIPMYSLWLFLKVHVRLRGA